MNYGATPARAFGDKRMKELHFRVLGIIALHDRRSNVSETGGQGCWASKKTIAAKAGCNFTNVCTAITELGAWGYVARGINPRDRRRTVYRVIYTEADHAYAKGCDSLPTGNHLPNGEQKNRLEEVPGGPIACPEPVIACPNPEIACPRDLQATENTDVSVTKRTKVREPKEKDFVETTRPALEGSQRGQGALLAVVSAKLKRRQPITSETIAALHSIVEDPDSRSLGGWAVRLLGEIEAAA